MELTALLLPGCSLAGDGGGGKSAQTVVAPSPPTFKLSLPVRYHGNNLHANHLVIISTSV